MKNSKNVIIVTSWITAISLVVLLIIGLEPLAFLREVYVWGISWLTLENIMFALFGSAALSLTVGIVSYRIAEENYMNKAAQFIHQSYYCGKLAFNKIQELNYDISHDCLTNQSMNFIDSIDKILDKPFQFKEKFDPEDSCFIKKNGKMELINMAIKEAYYYVDVCRQSSCEVHQTLLIRMTAETSGEGNSIYQSTSNMFYIELLEKKRLEAQQKLNKFSWELNHLNELSLIAYKFINVHKRRSPSYLAELDNNINASARLIETEEFKMDSKIVSECKVGIIADVSALVSLLDVQDFAYRLIAVDSVATSHLLMQQQQKINAHKYEVDILYHNDRKFNTKFKELAAMVTNLVSKINILYAELRDVSNDMKQHLVALGYNSQALNFDDKNVANIVMAYLEEHTSYGDVAASVQEILDLCSCEAFKESLRS